MDLANRCVMLPSTNYCFNPLITMHVDLETMLVDLLWIFNTNGANSAQGQ